MRIFTYIFLYIVVTSPVLSHAQQPLEDLRQGVEKGVQILEDARYKDASMKKIQQQKLWEVMQQIFDFREFSRRVLASHWKRFTPAQRDEFSQRFAEFLGKFYLTRVQRRYSGEKVFYVSQKLISESRALAEIKVLWKNVEVPVELRMKKSNGTWKVYDLTVLGINAVANYRAQFHGILKNQTPEEVIETLQARIRRLERGV
jgi:phospholipid transport system substrate-binding protein